MFNLPAGFLSPGYPAADIDAQLCSVAHDPVPADARTYFVAGVGAGTDVLGLVEDAANELVRPGHIFYTMGLRGPPQSREFQPGRNVVGPICLTGTCVLACMPCVDCLSDASSACDADCEPCLADPMNQWGPLTFDLPSGAWGDGFVSALTFDPIHLALGEGGGLAACSNRPAPYVEFSTSAWFTYSRYFTLPGAVCAGNYDVELRNVAIRVRLTPEFSPSSLCGHGLRVSLEELTVGEVRVVSAPFGCATVIEGALDLLTEGVDSFQPQFLDLVNAILEQRIVGASSAAKPTLAAVLTDLLNYHQGLDPSVPVNQTIVDIT